MNWEIRIDACTLPCIKQVVGKQLYNTGSLAQSSHDETSTVSEEALGGRSKDEGIYVYTQLTHFVVQQKTNTTL